MRDCFFLVQMNSLWAFVFAKEDDSSVPCVCDQHEKHTGTSYPANCQCLLPSFTISYTRTRVSWACPRATIPKPCLTVHHSNEPEHTMKQSSPCSSGIQSSFTPLASDKSRKKGMKKSFLGLKIIFWPPKPDICFRHYHIIILLSDVLRSQSATIKEIPTAVNIEYSLQFLGILCHIHDCTLIIQFRSSKAHSLLCPARSCVCNSNQVVHKIVRTKFRFFSE